MRHRGELLAHLAGDGEAEPAVPNGRAAGRRAGYALENLRPAGSLLHRSPPRTANREPRTADRIAPSFVPPGIEPPATQQATVEALCMFKHGIKPQWEDQANAAGGQWNWRPNVDQQDKGAGLDALWEELVLAMIGGIAFGGCANICGLRVVDKSRPAWPKGKGRQQRGRATCSYRFELWFSSGYQTDEERAGIAKELDELLSPVQRGLDFALKMHQQSLTQEAAFLVAKAEKQASVAEAAAESRSQDDAAAADDGATDP